MPLHEYECDVCSRRFEKIQKFSDPPIEVCPTCGGHVHTLISSPAFTFKGSGFYATDYAKKDAAGDSKTDGDSKGEASTKDAGGSAKDGGEKKDGAEKKSDTSSTSASTPSEFSTTKTTTKEQS
jgi:putative FmdB family regulatory protein